MHASAEGILTCWLNRWHEKVKPAAMALLLFGIFLVLVPDAIGKPPVITPTVELQHPAVHVGGAHTFRVSAAGGALSYQWRLDGDDLLGQTTEPLTFAAAQPSDEGDYTVEVRNLDAVVVSEPVRLRVVRLGTEFIKGNYYNTYGERSPCFYLLTEYNTGGHLGAALMGMPTPGVVDWSLAQRCGVPLTVEPLLSITSPTLEATLTTGAASVSLAGSAQALGQIVTAVAWENLANNATGGAVGTNTWTVTGIPLLADETNVVIVTATTTSWAPAFGGNTTFSDTLTAVCSPMRTLALQGADAILNWTGGVGPFEVQNAGDLAADDWNTILTNATPPLSLPLGARPDSLVP